MWFLVLGSVLLLAGWFYAYLKARPILKKEKIPWRAIYKRYAFHKNKAPMWRNFLIAHFLVTLVPWMWVSYLTYDTDHSYWIFLFPLVMYHYWSRYFLWEKSDLKER
ncbi:MAG: hypothetical protein NZM25_00555 [Leptospiraceae bacterium]|nr:hypothetical protein [Leptospiraceae bacterium]MDW8306215.1 hypothetical protein [Leptospiraceae bacterium]